MTKEEKRVAKAAYDKARYAKFRASNPLKPKIYSSSYRYKRLPDGSNETFHVLIAEKVLGKRLPKGAEVHHVDGNGLNNKNENLVICPNAAYHKLLHIRSAALEACGNANWLRCAICKKYDRPESMYLYTPKDQKSPRGQHRDCMYRQRYRRERP